MPMSWSEDHWPQLNYGKPITLRSVAKARGLYNYDWPQKWRENFIGPRLQLGWYRKNTAVKAGSDISLTERSGYLRLHPGPYKLSSPASPVALFRKQVHKQGIWRTRLSFLPEIAATEAGTVVYWNYFTWSSIGVRRAPSGGREVTFTPVEGDKASAELKSPGSEVDLVIECQPSKYRFGYHEVEEGARRVASEAHISWLGDIATASMIVDPPIGMSFTGMMLGLYGYSEMQRGLAPADFAFAEFL